MMRLDENIADDDDHVDNVLFEFFDHELFICIDDDHVKKIKIRIDSACA